MPMANKKILALTDMDFRGSGYFYLMSPILQGLSSQGYDIKVVGLGYTGEEHLFDYTIVPTKETSEGVATATNIIKLWKPDLFICGMDILLQVHIFEQLSKLGIKYMAITPLENPPLRQSWAAQLMMMNYTFFISEIGADAAQKAGVDKSGYLPIGINTTLFHPATNEEKQNIRKGLGFGKDDYIILTVADNQERKNLWASMKVVSLLLHPSLTSEEFDKICIGDSTKKVADYEKVGSFKHVLVTREKSVVGYNLVDLASTMDINKEFTIIERGIPQDELRNLYVMSDVFLLLSKAEGLGIPILEAMACEIPVVATDTGAIWELLSDGRGYLVPEKYGFIDVWGNSWRSMADIEYTVAAILRLFKSGTSLELSRIREYVIARTLGESVSLVKEQIRIILDEN
jgi:glycosyltransferase involved in cell wall biosynthesis